MGKYADRYSQVHPWKIIEEGFDPDYSQVAESIFSLGNEYTGLRGYFDEGYSGPRLQGSYLNGVYERRMLPKSGYKGMLPFTEFMVNTVDWVYTRISKMPLFGLPPGAGPAHRRADPALCLAH